MDILNKNIILMDHLYKYEHSDVDIDNIYWSIKNEIYQITLFSDKPSDNVLKKVEKNIKDFYKLYNRFNFSKVFYHPNPILYISYLSHAKEKIILH